MRSILGGGLTGGVRIGGRTEEAIGLAGGDEDEASYRGASCKVTVLVKVMGASIELRCDR